jgi:hypothetical protein
MSEAGFEPTITASERVETVNAIDHSATVTGIHFALQANNPSDCL